MKVQDVPRAFEMLAKKQEQAKKGDKLSDIERQAQEQSGGTDGPTDGEVERRADEQENERGGAYRGEDPDGALDHMRKARTQSNADQGKMLTDEERAFQRRKADAPRWIDETIKRIEGFNSQHEIDAAFGHPDYPDMGEKATKLWASWIEQNEPELFKKLKKAFRAKIKQFNDNKKAV
jgi:hypothetical protein